MTITATTTLAYITDRETRRLAAGREAWERIKARLETMGVRSELFGSMARGNNHDRSDIDILVEDRNGHSYGAILFAAEDEAGDIPVDVVFVEDLPPHRVKRMRHEATA